MVEGGGRGCTGLAARANAIKPASAHGSLPFRELLCGFECLTLQEMMPYVSADISRRVGFLRSSKPMDGRWTMQTIPARPPTQHDLWTDHAGRADQKGRRDCDRGKGSICLAF